MKCSKCGFEVDSTAKYCSQCGEEMNKPQKKICPNCDYEMDMGSLFCPQCGKEVGQNPLKAEQPQSKRQGSFFGRLFKGILITFVCLALVATLLFFAACFSDWNKHYKKSESFGQYLKDFAGMFTKTYYLESPNRVWNNFKFVEFTFDVDINPIGTVQAINSGNATIVCDYWIEVNPEKQEKTKFNYYDSFVEMEIEVEYEIPGTSGRIKKYEKQTVKITLDQEGYGRISGRITLNGFTDSCYATCKIVNKQGRVKIEK